MGSHHHFDVGDGFTASRLLFRIEEVQEGNKPSESTTTRSWYGRANGPSEDKTGAVSIGIRKTDLGSVLVDSKGMTLYVFANDKAGVPTCTGSCEQLWPALVGGSVDVAKGLAESDFSVVKREDGRYQVRFRRLPLYLYAGDAKPGDTNGHGVGGVWQAVGPDGPFPLGTKSNY